MAAMTKEQIKEEFIKFFSDNYGYWTDSENSQEAIPYMNGAFDFMTRCVDILERTVIVNEVGDCGEK